MKKSHLATLVAALLLLSAPLTACTQSPAGSDSSDPSEIVTIPEVAAPEKPDERAFTDLTPYTDNLATLFAVATPAPAEHFTYEIVGEGMPDHLDGTVTITGYTGGASVLIIPETIEGCAVTAIAKDAFKDNTVLTAVSVPNTVTSIGVGAFSGCKSLKSMRTPVFTCDGAPFFGALFGATTPEANGYSVPTLLSTLVISEAADAVAPIVIPEAAFYACRNLKIIELPSLTEEIGDFAFYGCQSLEYIVTGATRVTSVGRNAFTNCEALLTLDLPATVETLGFAMLEGCGKLESLTLPFVGGNPSEAETAYLGYLFGAADYTFTAGFLPASLISVTLLEGCGDIPDNAFFECASVREFHLPQGVTAIGRRAFYGCKRLAEMTLPQTVKTIGDDAFHGCVSMKTFHGGDGLTSLGVQAFMSCVSLTEVSLPASVTYLPNGCFSGCSALAELTAPGVTSQGQQVFRHCYKLGAPWIEIAAADTAES